MKEGEEMKGREEGEWEKGSKGEKNEEGQELL